MTADFLFIPPRLARISSTHIATIQWHCREGDFASGQYSREHTWTFDGGLEIPASPSPHVVPVPWSNPTAVDPEEALIASIASCHMLTFLWLAAKKGYSILSYSDQATGFLTKNEKRIPWLSHVQLSPTMEWSGSTVPSKSEVRELHERAHEQCFIANSVKTQISIQCEACSLVKETPPSAD